MEKQLKNISHATAILRAAADQGRVSGDLAADLQMGGRVRYQNATMEIRKDVSGFGSGTNKLIDSNTEKLTGISDFRGNRLAKKEAFVATHVQVQYGAGENKEIPAIALTHDLEANLLAAKLIFSVRGNKIFEMPMGDLVADAAERNANEKGFELALPVIIPDDEQIDIEVELGQGASVGSTPGTKKVLRAAFHGVKTVAN